MWFAALANKIKTWNKPGGDANLPRVILSMGIFLVCPLKGHRLQRRLNYRLAGMGGSAERFGVFRFCNRGEEAMWLYHDLTL